MLNLKPKFYKISAAIFLAAEIALGVLIQTVEGVANHYLSFSSIALAALFVLLMFRRERIYYLSLIAMGTTLCADFLLVIVTPPERLLAMLFFSVTQISYFLIIYLLTGNKRIKRVHLCTRAAILAFTLIITCAVLGEDTDALSIVSMLYFTNLALNILFSFFIEKRRWLFTLGLISFICCDIFVGMSMIGNYISVGNSAIISFFADPPFNAVWFFYVPAQTLLALFSMKNEGNRC